MEMSKEKSDTIIRDLSRTMASAARLKDPNEKRSNTLDAVTDLLTSLLDPESARLMRAAAKGTSGSIGVGGIGTKSNNQYLPSFNLRTPIMEISLNGQEIYPNKRDLDSGEMVEARLNFEDFKISFPMGGVEKSITGSLQLFTKDPKEILIPLDVFNSQNGVPGGDTSTGGFPLVTIRFGWAFSDSSVGGDKISKAMSPKLNFIATNIAMTDPGTAGTTFTLTLQEIGNMILEYSTDDILIMSDYPQQQLRLLLEGLLHVRLFTLDDLLYLGEKNNQGALSLDLSGPQKVTAVVTAQPAPAPAPVSPNTPPVIYNTISTTTNKFGLGAPQQPRISLSRSLAEERDRKAATEAAAANAAVTAASTTSVTSSKTFFTTKESAAFGINSRTFFTVAKELASQCRCKWYPHDNTEAAVTADAEETSEATNKVSSLAKDLKLVKDTPGNILSADLSTSIRKNFNNKDTDTTTKLEKSKAEQDLTAELRKTMARLSTRSKLFWVPNVPSSWNTTGSSFYASGQAELGEAFPYETGAFFLLPDVLDDYDIFLQDLPIQYGPGASALPYFYGSAQNIFQTSLNKSPSEMFGEVQTLSVNHSSLIVALSQATNEKLAYAVNGKRMGQLEAALAHKANGSMNINNTMTREDSSKNYEEVEARGNKLNAKGREIQKQLRGKLRSSRFKGSAGSGTSGTLLVLDPTEINGKPLSGAEKSFPGGADPGETKTGQAQSTTYNIKSRVASFLRYPTEAKITILGDPNLIRLGPGCFELISYYPVQHNDGSVTHEINGLTSGLYFVNKIDHAISGGSFMTSLNGYKLIDPFNVPSSFTNQLISKLLATKKIKKDKKDEGVNPENQINTLKNKADQLAIVDLTDPNFTTGFLSTELNKIFNTYKTYQDADKKIERK